MGGESSGGSFCSKCVGFICLTIGLIFAIGGIVVALFLPQIVQKGITKYYSVCSISDPGYNNNINVNGSYWVKTNAFTIVNPQGVIAGETPKFQEVGPFFYNVISTHEFLNTFN